MQTDVTKFMKTKAVRTVSYTKKPWNFLTQPYNPCTYKQGLECVIIYILHCRC